MTTTKVPLEKLTLEPPYASILCYPRSTRTEVRKRLAELKRLRVAALEFRGEKSVSNVAVLGKGYVSVVVLAYRDGERVALKIRRTDADRPQMNDEAELLETANRARVGPRLFDVSKDFLVMQFIRGELFPAWLRRQRGKRRVSAVLREILEQCRRLDVAGLDHGELSHAPKHIIVTGRDKPFIVDFESASLSRRPSNVTSICQFLFVSGQVSESVAKRLGKGDRRMIIRALQHYKGDRTRENFARVLAVCGLLDNVSHS